jgi:hypothetical protein
MKMIWQTAAAGGWLYWLSATSCGLRCRFAHCKLAAHPLELQCLLFEACRESFQFFLLPRKVLLLPRDGRFQLLHLAVLFEELVKQHRVHRLITHGDNHPLVIASHEIGVDLFHLLGHQANEDARRG